MGTTIANLKEALDTISGGNVLDVATGAGGFIRLMQGALHDAESYTGIDPVERAITAARGAGFPENVRFEIMDAEELKFTDGQFDTVSICSSLHHLEKLDQSLKEMLRVLRAGGTFIVCEMYRDVPSEAQMTHVLLHDWWAATGMARGIIHYPTFTRGEIIRKITALPLDDVQVWDWIDDSGDPLDPEGLKEIEAIIDRDIELLKTLPDGEALIRTGEELRARLRRVGVQNAAALVIVGKKAGQKPA